MLKSPCVRLKMYIILLICGVWGAIIFPEHLEVYPAKWALFLVHFLCGLLGKQNACWWNRQTPRHSGSWSHPCGWISGHIGSWVPPSLAKRGPPSNTVYAGLVLVFDLKALGWADTLSTERVTMLSCSQWLSGSGIKKEPEGNQPESHKSEY